MRSCAHAAGAIAGNLAEALTLYIKAAEFLQQALVEPSLQQERPNMEKTLRSYLVRAEAIEQELNGTAPTLPRVPGAVEPATTSSSSGGMAPADGTLDRAVARSSGDGAAAAPTVLQVGYSAIKVRSVRV